MLSIKADFRPQSLEPGHSRFEAFAEMLKSR